MNDRNGPLYVFKNLVIDPLRKTYEDLDRIAYGVDLVVTHSLSFAAQLVVEKRRLPWLSTVLQPAAIFSIYDPVVLSEIILLNFFRSYTEPGFYRGLYKLIRARIRPTMKPFHDLRKDIGLPPTDKDPFFQGQFSPQGNLVMYSSVMGKPQPDWPVNSHQVGFCFYDKLTGEVSLSDKILDFLKKGAPPIVFTLGSRAVMNAGDFYKESILAAQILGKRAILLTGRDERYQKLDGLNDKIIACRYAPYSELLPHALVIVHQGGAGTTGQVLRSGRPSLVVPWGQDQYDNANRMCKLGVARTISKKVYSGRLTAKELDVLMSDSAYEMNAQAISKIVCSDNGPRDACDLIEKML